MTRVIMLTGSLLVAAFPLPARTITLVEDGHPTATVITAPDADDNVQEAADELVRCVKAASGAKLPQATPSQDVKGPKVIIGPCALTRPDDFPPQELGIEAYAIRARGNAVVLVSGAEFLTSFAVYSFLERYLGVRWFCPGEIGEHIPKARSLQLNVTNEDVAPDMSPRFWWPIHGWEKMWMRHNKVSRERSRMPFAHFQNHIYRVFPPSKYAETHPEYYPLIDGERWIPPGDDYRYWRPCESNPEVRDIVLQNARKWFDEHPERFSYSLGMDDIQYMCGCENCRALDARSDDYENRRSSDRHYWFVNQIARRLAKTHPDKYVGTMAYGRAKQVPATIDRLEPNVFVNIAQCAAEWRRPDKRATDVGRARRWARFCPNITTYDYLGLTFLTPRYYPHLLDDAVKLNDSLGFRGGFVETNILWPNVAPMMWAYSKLQWDRTLDIDALLDEFMTKFFGPARQPMARYYDTLEQSWRTPRPGRDGWGHGRLNVMARGISIEAVGQCERHIEAAKRRAANNTTHLERVEMVGAGLLLGSFPIRAVRISERLHNLPIDSDATVEGIADDISRLNEISRTRERVWERLSSQDDLVGRNIRALKERSSSVWGQTSVVEGGADAVLSTIVAYYEKQDREPWQILDILDNLLPRKDYAIARAYLTAVASGQPSLVVNGDFEQAGGNRRPPQREDWSTAGAPGGWTTWRQSPAPELSLDPTGGLNGSRAVRIAKADAACFMQSLHVAPAQRYVVSCWARCEPVDARHAVRLRVRWRKPSGDWLDTKSYDRTAQHSMQRGEWERMWLLTTVPPDAGILTVMLSANWQGNAAALFDDARVYRVR